MDRWKLKEVKQMQLGGNKAAQAYFEKNNMFVDGKPNHKAPQLAKYKQDLLKRVEVAIGHTLQSQGSATFSRDDRPKEGPLARAANNNQLSSDNIFEFTPASNGAPSFGGQQSQAVKEEVKELNSQKSSKSMGAPGLTSQFSGGFGGFGLSKQQNPEVKTLNAKKLEVNFDNDDFFNSFEPGKASQPAVQKTVSLGPGSDKFVTKLQEVDDQFDLVPKQQSQFGMSKQLSFGDSTANGTTLATNGSIKYTQPEND
jgi:hypothetical protein